jgi:peptidoglycan/LPS O-acetylase OafA/YrhL
MAVGGYAAYLALYNKRFLDKIKSLNKRWWFVLYGIIAIIFLFRKVIFDGNILSVAANRLIISLLFALVILEQNYATTSFYKMSNNKTISKWGVYTYGLYCLHMIGILIAAKGLALVGMNKNVYQVIFLEGGLSLLITLLLAYTSYHLFEKRFLRLKEKFALIRTTNTDADRGAAFFGLIGKPVKRLQGRRHNKIDTR